MSSLNTTTLNNTLKAQQLSGKKALQETAQAAGNTGFENLFANALSQRANPQAKLSMINEELQEALGGSSSRSSEGNKKPFKASEKDTEANANLYGMSGSTLAQANMWAQREWAQSNRAESSNVGSSVQSTGRPADLAPKSDENLSKSSEGAVQSAAAEASGNGSSTNSGANATEVKSEEQVQKSSQDNAEAVQAEANPSNTQSATSAESSANAQAVASDSSGAELSASSSNLDAASLQVAEQNSVQSSTQTATQDPSTGLKLDANLPNQAAQQGAEGKVDIKVSNKLDTNLDSTAGFKSDSLKTQSDGSTANNQNSQTSQINRPDLTQTAAIQAQQTSSGRAGANARTLKAGDEILATSGTNAGAAANSGTSGSTASTQANAGIGLAGMATGRTGSAAEATIKTPVNQPGFVKELGAQVQWAVGKNLSTVDIRLNAGQMGGDAGSMNMRIIQRGQDIQLVIRTQDEATASMLNQTIAGLKESMAQNGLQLTQVQIQSGNNAIAAGNSSLANAQQQAQQQANQSGNQSGGQSGRQGNSQGNTNSDGQTEVTEPQRRNRSNGNIDLVA
jgi:hypothetical protein